MRGLGEGLMMYGKAQMMTNMETDAAIKRQEALAKLEDDRTKGRWTSVIDPETGSRIARNTHTGEERVTGKLDGKWEDDVDKYGNLIQRNSRTGEVKVLSSRPSPRGLDATTKLRFDVLSKNLDAARDELKYAMEGGTEDQQSAARLRMQEISRDLNRLVGREGSAKNESAGDAPRRNPLLPGKDPADDSSTTTTEEPAATATEEPAPTKAKEAPAPDLMIEGEADRQERKPTLLERGLDWTKEKLGEEAERREGLVAERESRASEKQRADEEALVTRMEQTIKEKSMLPSISNQAEYLTAKRLLESTQVSAAMKQYLQRMIDDWASQNVGGRPTTRK